MRWQGKGLPGLIAVLLVIAAPLQAFIMIESIQNQQKVRLAQGATFRMTINFAQPVLCDGSVKLQPGRYNAEFVSMADGSVRATFPLPNGQRGEAHGMIIINSRPGAASPASSIPTETLSLNFDKLNFTPASRTNFSTLGSKANLEIVSSDGSHSLFIWFALP